MTIMKMRKLNIFIAALLLTVAGSMSAQTPANRTANTIVADVLAQMPANKVSTYNGLMKDLVSTGEEGVQLLIQRFNAPGKGSNAAVDYALSGLSNFVMQKGEESARATVAKAYVKALSTVTEREAKAFVIRQLQFIGDDDAVDALAACLKDESVSAPAAEALSAIGSKKAGSALLAALNGATPAVQKNLVRAISEMKVGDSELAIQKLAGSSDKDLQKEVLYALSKVGTKSSLPILAAAASAVGYTFDYTGANEAYIALIKRLAANGDTVEATKAATSLLAVATAAGKGKVAANASMVSQLKGSVDDKMQTRIAATGILLSLKSAEANKMIMTALKDPSKEYRDAVLNFAAGKADKALYIDLIKSLPKMKAPQKTDILNWIAAEAQTTDGNAVLKNLELRFDQPAQQVLIAQVKDKDQAVKSAAVWALTRIGNAEAIPTIAGLLASNDTLNVNLAKDALESFNSDIDVPVAKVVGTASDAGKIAGVGLLAGRHATANIQTVLDQTKSSSPAVRAAAYDALKGVVGERDLTNMCGMLETADASAVEPMQAAVISALSEVQASDRAQTITHRMIQAGESKKHLYYPVLASTGDKEALATIVKDFKNGTDVQKDAAFNALLKWEGQNVKYDLYEIAKDPSASAYAERAVDAYIAKVSDQSLTGENRLLGLRQAMEIAKTDAQRNAILNAVGKTNTYLGLLFAGQYLDNKPVQQSAANAVMNIAMNNKECYGADVRALLNKTMEVLDNPDASYQKEGIKKLLAEMPEGEGFVPMFNGKDLTGWKGLLPSPNDNPYKRAKLKPADLKKAEAKAAENMVNDWKAEDGQIVYFGKGFDNLCTTKEYGDFEMYVDWRLDPAGPEADAGVYLRGTPQVQIWDTARVNVGAQVGSGGLYNNQVNPSKPTQVADNKLGEWNNFYIKMVGDRVTVILNGVKVVDDVILENYWDRTKAIFPIGDIELQAHASKVYFRNLYIKELKRPEPFQLSAQEKKEGFRVLFDGTNMHEWTGNTVDYTLEDGCISLNPSKSYGGNLYTKDEFANFVYRFDFCLTPGANNGVGIRTPMEGDAAYVGMEIQILDCEHPIYSTITPLQHHGSVYGIIPAKPDHHAAFKPAGEWNTEEITANGDNICVKVNGIVITEGNIRDAVKNGTPDHHEHPGLFNKTGHIGFLGHGSPVKFRNIRIKELK